MRLGTCMYGVGEQVDRLKGQCRGRARHPLRRKMTYVWEGQ